MVGHYVNLLDKPAEDRVLGLHMGPGNYAKGGTRCLVGCASGYDMQFADDEAEISATRFFEYWSWMRMSGWGTVEAHYDALCHRFGTARINEAIRSRILVNQLKRSLAAVRATAGV